MIHDSDAWIWWIRFRILSHSLPAMVTSGIPRHRRLKHAMPLLVLLCLARLLLCDAQLNFVQGVRWTRLKDGHVSRFGLGNAQAKIMTANVKKTSSAKELIDLLETAMDGPIFDLILASAIYTQLVRLKRKRLLQRNHWESPVILSLHARVQKFVLQNDLRPRESANILWSIAQLSDQFRLPHALLAALVKSVPKVTGSMNAQDLSNTLWACAKLKDWAPGVVEMVPAIATQIPKRAKQLKPQELSNCLWAAEQLKHVAPNILESVPAIVAEIPNKAKGMKPQELSSCLWASVLLKKDAPKALETVPAIVGEIPTRMPVMSPQDLSNSLEALVFLQDSEPEMSVSLGALRDIVRSAAMRLSTLFSQLTGKDLSFTAPVVVWACAKTEVREDGDLLLLVARRCSSRSQLSRIPDFGVCALLWSYQVLDTQDDFADFRKLLISETSRRGLSEMVEHSQRGRFRWKRR